MPELSSPSRLRSASGGCEALNLRRTTVLVICGSGGRQGTVVQTRDPWRISRSKNFEDFPRHHNLRNSLESMIRNASSKARIYMRDVSSRALYPRSALLRKSALIQSRLGRQPSISLATPIIQRNISSASAIDYSSFNDETIYAVSTAPGRAGIAIVRISGPSFLEVSTLHHRFTDH